MLKRLEKKLEIDPTTLNSKIRNDYLTSDQKGEKLSTLKEQNVQLKRKVTDLETKLSEVLSSQGEHLNENLNSSFRQIILEHKDSLNSLPDSSPQKLLWTQQLKYVKKTDKRKMRWHPTIIKWCIAIHSKSSKAYDLMRKSGVLNLSHESTLRDYTHFTTATSGWNLKIVDRIKDDIRFEKLEKFQKNVILLFDEIKIKDGLVYSTETGELIGFLDLGDVNNEIEKLVNICRRGDDSDDELQPLATHIIAFMVRGIFLNLHQVFGHFPCTGFNSHQLYWSVWSAIGILECAGFHVRALVCDGATPNRKFYRIHGVRQDSLTFYSENRYRSGSRIYFICDPPHLMKTTRNNWENSNWHNKTRNLEFDRQQITWPHLVTLVEGDLHGQNGQPGGLRMLPKLTNEHLRLTPSLRMKVKLATQVLSSSVARAFELVDRLRPITRSTRKFIVYMDTFFDCLNVSRLNLDNRKSKCTLGPYQNIADWRLEWLEQDFLQFLREWENQSNARLDISKEKRKRLCLSRETLEGLRITVKSFTKLVRELLSEPGVQYVLSGKFSQDPLEIYFSKQRGCGGNNDNPTVLDFNRNARNIFVAGTAAIRGAARGNCSVDPNDGMPVCGAPLQRRQKPR
ncbi:THAP9 [Mytilus coruscus]|uniref:THAP9 n=1 Tax=Mytilus coruscus TaxID=42192 RepID=A0A6J8C6X5_MYTCO|nr:THAP9 [Mytilus coruscus]